MGMLARASCDCGYTVRLMLGGGMANCDIVCLFPAYCRGCRSLRQVNLLDLPIVCGDCGGSEVVSYDDPELLGEAGTDEVFSWEVDEPSGRVVQLSDGVYLCPSCQRMRLRFEDKGSWD